MTDNVPSPSRRWIWAGAALLAVVIAVIVVVVFVSPGGSSSAPSAPTPSSSPSSAPSDEPRDATAEPSADPTGPAQPVTVPLDAEATVQPGLTVRVASLESVDGEPLGPGEVGGPALRVIVEFANESGEDLDLTTAAVNLSYGADRTPANPVSGPGASAFPASAAPGQTVTGTFVFSVPADERGSVTVEVDYSTQTSIILFTGAAPA